MYMKTRKYVAGTGDRRRAFSLVEVLVAMSVISIAFVSLYAGITSGVAIIKLARENLRATQIMLEKMETIRICSWDQVTSGTNIPPQFVDTFYPAATQLEDQGTKFYGTVILTNVTFWTNYRDDMRQVIVQVRWTNWSDVVKDRYGITRTNFIARFREMRSLVAKEGMQNYVF